MNGDVEEENRLKVKVSNEGEISESLEELTDDNVFKELINIVVDVFSHKSEKCMLTFELPIIQSDILSSVPSDNMSEPIEDLPVVSVVKIPITSSESSIVTNKSSMDGYNLKYPINKSSRQSFKKQMVKRWYPIVQTVLNRKQNFTDLEQICIFRRQSSSCIQRLQDNMKSANRLQPRRKELVEQKMSSGRSNGEGTTFFGENCDFHLVNKTFIQNDTNEGCVETRELPRHYSELVEILDSLKLLMLSTSNEHISIDTHRIEFHVSEMKSHILAIKHFLVGGSIEQSSLFEDNETKLDSPSGSALILRNFRKKQGVSLCRSINSQIHQRKWRTLAHTKPSKFGDVSRATRKVEHNLNLKELLERYRRIKQEETHIVKILLSTVSASEGDRENHRRRRSSRRLRNEISVGKNERFTQTFAENREANKWKQDVEYCEVLNRNPRRIKKSSKRKGGINIVSAPQNNAGRSRGRPRRRLLTRSFMNRDMGASRLKIGKYHRHKHTVVQPPPIKEHKDVPNMVGENNFLEPGYQKDIDEVSQRQKNSWSASLPSKEEDTLMRIHNVAERLEHIQLIVEQKLDYFCKKNAPYREVVSMDQESQIARGGVMKDQRDIDYELRNENVQYPGFSLAVTEMGPKTSFIQYTLSEESGDFHEVAEVVGTPDETQYTFKKSVASSNQELQRVEEEESRERVIASKSYTNNCVAAVRNCNLNDTHSNLTNQLEPCVEDNIDTAFCKYSERYGFLNDKTEQNGTQDRDNEEQTTLKPRKEDDSLDDCAVIEEPSLFFNEPILTIEKVKIEGKKRRNGNSVLGKSRCTLS